MGRVGGMNWAGFVLTLLVLGVFMVSAFCFQEDFERRRRDEQETEKEPDRRRDRHRHMSRRGRELMLEKPRELFSSEGGSLRVWEKIPALEESEIDVQAARFILRQRGMILPKYDDSACMGYVEEGEGLVGYLTGYSLGERVRQVRRGDVVAFPRGIAHWWYNSGNQEMRIIAFADTSAGLKPGDVTMFSLVGGKHEEGMRETGLDLGSILHGFGKEFLAESWGLDMSDVEEILYSQKGVGIIKAEREVDIHRMARDEEQDSKEAAGGSTGENFGDFVYNVRHSTPDLMVEEAGFATVVNKFKLPVLQYMKMGLSYGRLEREAILAPHWSPSGHRVVHILQGEGTVEIAGNSGDRIMSKEVREGDVFVIPRFFPAGMMAGGQGLEWISFYTTNLPYVEALAGKTSVYKNLPLQVSAAAFNMDEDRLREIRKKRMRSAILLPPRGRTHGHHLQDEDVEDQLPSTLGMPYL